jgi:hypothetical protein
MKDKFLNASRDKLGNLETRLARTLQPIKPSRTFVNGLRQRIHIASPPVIVHRATDFRFWLVVIGSVVTGLVLIITGTRALYYLISRSKG